MVLNGNQKNEKKAYCGSDNRLGEMVSNANVAMQAESARSL